MKEQTGVDYSSSTYMKSLLVEKAKAGKTMFIAASLLGVLPWQKFGGIVGKPKNLHILTFDSGALSGLRGFLKMCNAPEEALNFRVYNMQNDLMKAAASKFEYDRTFFNTVLTTIQTIHQRAQVEGGTHALHVSSLTGMVEGLLRGVQGPAGVKKGGGMDQSKWGDFAGQIAEVRNFAHQDNLHVFWEAHIYTPPKTGQPGQDDENKKETLQMPGKSGQNFPYNVEQVFRVRREWSNTWEGTRIDKTYIDPRGGDDFMQGGRNFDQLKDKEYDLTAVAQKLGFKIGGWGAKKLKEKKGA